MMTLPQLGQVANVSGFISVSVNRNTTKLGRMVDQHALILPRSYDDITNIMSCEQHLWLYLHFYKTYNNKTSQEETSVQCSYLEHNDDFISNWSHGKRL